MLSAAVMIGTFSVNTDFLWPVSFKALLNQGTDDIQIIHWEWVGMVGRSDSSKIIYIKVKGYISMAFFRYFKGDNYHGFLLWKTKPNQKGIKF